MAQSKPVVRNIDLESGRFEIEQHVAEPMSAAHWHDHVEINLLVSGAMTYLFNGREERVEAGHLVLFWAAIPHRTIDVEAGSPLICIYLPLAEMLSLPIEREAKQAVMQGSFLVTAAADALDISVASRWIVEWTGGNDAVRRIVAEEVNLRVRRMLLSPLAMRPARSGAGSVGRSQVRRAEELIELIKQHYAEPLSLPLLASMAGIHPSTAASAFRSVLGISLNEYLIRYRLALAMHRLADTADPILDIAFSSGFGSTSRFYDLFKRRTGRTPNQFRLAMSRG
jgi:AraC-like DNA-binding protein/quercetin dioxygenase-like cupin family protein